MSVQTSFLTSGPTLTLTLPESLFPGPVLTSPLDMGNGGRSFTYFPSDHPIGEFDPATHVTLPSLVSPLGPVEVIERTELPIQWYLIWTLKAGALVTHLREEDGLHAAETLVELVEVEYSSAGFPVLFPRKPLRRAATRAPGNMEMIVFVDDPLNSGKHIALSRPGALRASKWTDAAETHHVATGRGVDVEGHGVPAEQVEDIAQQVAEEIDLTSSQQ